MSHLTSTITETAPAKVNLYLHITGRRKDGYHLLDSLVAFARLGDVIGVRPAADLTLQCHGPFADDLPTATDNLAIRAADALRRSHGIGDGAQIRLQKNLPVAAGLGGGSADAAATFRALCRLWKIPVKPDTLTQLALGLGADVPVCLDSAAKVMSGIGDHVEAAPPLPHCPLVLMNPSTPLATRDVFKARTGGCRKPDPLRTASGDVAELARQLRRRHNDLYETARQMLPEIGHGVALLTDQPGCLVARMSGSGASVFGLFSTASEARRATERLSARLSGWWVASTDLIA